MDDNKIIITIHHDLMRIDRFLRDNSHIPYHLIQRILRENFVTVNGKAIKKGEYRLKTNDEVVILYDFKGNLLRRKKVVPVDYNPLVSNIIFEHKDFFIINKLANMESQDTVNNLMKNIDINCHLVHRLDKDTSGLMIIARHRTAAREFFYLFQGRKIYREYKAILVGNCNIKPQYIETNIARDFYDRKVGNFEGKTALTYIDPIVSQKNYSLVKLVPITGRNHQIRIHCSYINFPIVGDRKYGKFERSSLMLHSTFLKFLWNEKEFQFDSPFIQNYINEL